MSKEDANRGSWSLRDKEERRILDLYNVFVISHREEIDEYRRRLIDFRVVYNPDIDNYELVMVESPQSMGN